VVRKLQSQINRETKHFAARQHALRG